MFWGRTTSMHGQRVPEVPCAQRFFVWRRSTRGLIGQKINLNQPPNHQLKDHHLKSQVTFDRYRKNLSPTQGNHSWTSSSRSAKFFQAGKDGMGPPKEASDRGLGSLEFKLLSDEHLTKGALGVSGVLCYPNQMKHWFWVSCWNHTKYPAHTGSPQVGFPSNLEPCPLKQVGLYI